MPKFAWRRFWMPPFLWEQPNYSHYCRLLNDRIIIGPGQSISLPDQYIRKQDVIHLSSIQMVGLSGIQMARMFGIQPLFDHSNTRLVWFSDPHWTCFCNLLDAATRKLATPSWLNTTKKWVNGQTAAGWWSFRPEFIPEMELRLTNLKSKSQMQSTTK